MYQFNDFGGGSGSGTAALSLDHAVFRPRAQTATFGQRSRPRRALGDVDLVVDLGQRIGSPEWLRGFVTCGALCYAAWSLGPNMAPLPGASPTPMPEAHFEEARALAIAPLAYGADTGRRMAPTDAVRPLTESPERPVIDLRATLGRGDGRARVHERAGVGAAEADRIATMIGEVVPIGDIRPGTAVDLTLGRRPNRMVARPLEKLSLRASFDLRIEVTRSGENLTLTRIRHRYVDSDAGRTSNQMDLVLWVCAGVPDTVRNEFRCEQQHVGQDVLGQVTQDGSDMATR